MSGGCDEDEVVCLQVSSEQWRGEGLEKKEEDEGEGRDGDRSEVRWFWWAMMDRVSS